jgi:succinate dehydrogenase / fumarate reductase cytochrome b subunit
VAWLVFLAGGPDAYALFTKVCQTKVGQVFLVGWTWAFFYHFCCGIRHLMWDAGWFLTIRGMHITGWITLFISTALTIGIWLKIWDVLPW